MTVSLGYTIFTVNDVDQTLTFYTDAFGLARRFITPSADYGELETGQTVLAFVANSLAHENLDAAGGFAELDPAQPPIAGSVTLVTDDVAGVVAQAISCGATEYVPIANKPWGQTVCYLRDPNGLMVEVATPVSSE